MASYGSQFASASLTLVALLVAAGIQALQVPVFNLVIARGKMWVTLLLITLWAATILVLNGFFVRWGALGVASARLASYVVSSAWVSYMAYRVMSPETVDRLADSRFSKR
jgi:O-antigen/teichoic acid export membrane protein